MSGIYIPNFEPSKEGYISYIYPDGTVVKHKSEEPFLEICKAIPVPDHGRLIDGDALIDELPGNLGIRGLEYLNRQESAIVSWIHAAPTIIPADKEGEG